MSRPFIRTFSVTVVSAVLAVALAGCGGSGSTASQSAPTTATTTSHPKSAADKRIARHAQLKLTDFSSGWKQHGSQTSKSQERCPAAEATRAAASAWQQSPTFVTTENPQVEAASYVFSDVSGAKRAFRQLSGGSTRLCFADTLTKRLANPPKGLKFGKITSGQVAMRPVGDESVVDRLTIPVTVSGQNVDFYVDLVFARVGRGIAGLDFFDTITPFDEALRNRLTTTLVGRLKTG
jgi:hypothetical protein